MTSAFTRAAVLAGVITLGAATAASAQTPPPGPDGAPRVERRVVIMGGPGGPGMHRPGGPGMGMHGPMDPEKHAQHLRDVLQLRPDQEGALKAFIAAMTPPKPPAAASDGPPTARPAMPQTTPERLAMMERMMAEHQAMFRKHNDAIRAFYGQLSPSQQKAFDALHMGMGMGMGMGGMHQRGMRMMHRGGPGAPMAMGGGDMMFMGGPGDDEEIEIELGEGPDAPDQ